VATPPRQDNRGWTHAYASKPREKRHTVGGEQHASQLADRRADDLSAAGAAAQSHSRTAFTLGTLAH